MSTERALELLHGLMLEDGRTWGKAATDIQRADARAVLGDTVRRHWIGRSRGYSKTTDLAAFTIVAMLEVLPAGAHAYGLASDRDQAALLTSTMAELIHRTPGLLGAFEINAYRITAPSTGSVFEAIAADAPGAWGLRPAWVVVDELANWSSTTSARSFFEAVMTALPKVPGSRAAIISTPGDPAHWAHGVYAGALAETALWRVSEVHGPPPWMPADLLEAERRRLPESLYRRLFLGEWTAAEDRLVGPDDLRACVTLDGPLPPRPGVRYVIAVDIGLKKDRTVAAVAHSEPISTYHDAFNEEHHRGHKVVLDRMQVWQGSRLRPVRLDDVEVWLRQAHETFNRPELILDPWQAVGLGQRLRQAGLRVEEFTFSSANNGRLASTLHLLLRDHALDLPDDPELLDELANVRLKETTPGVLRLDHDAGQHDDRAVTLAMAAQALLSKPKTTPHPGWHYSVSRDGGVRFVSPDDDPMSRLLRQYAAAGDETAQRVLEKRRLSPAAGRRAR